MEGWKINKKKRRRLSPRQRCAVRQRQQTCFRQWGQQKQLYLAAHFLPCVFALPIESHSCSAALTGSERRAALSLNSFIWQQRSMAHALKRRGDTDTGRKLQQSIHLLPVTFFLIPLLSLSYFSCNLMTVSFCTFPPSLSVYLLAICRINQRGN